MEILSFNETLKVFFSSCFLVTTFSKMASEYETIIEGF